MTRPAASWSLVPSVPSMTQAERDEMMAQELAFTFEARVGRIVPDVFDGRKAWRLERCSGDILPGTVVQDIHANGEYTAWAFMPVTEGTITHETMLMVFLGLRPDQVLGFDYLGQHEDEEPYVVVRTIGGTWTLY